MRHTCLHCGETSWSATAFPVSEGERLTQIDILRGVALSGVLLVNRLESFRISLFAHILGSDAPLGPAGSIVSTFVSEFIEFKAITLFSFLFGVGIAVQVKRLRGRMNVHAFLARRFAVLLLFGAAHMVFIWNGDILMLYAICGLATISLLGLPVSALAIIGAVLTIGPAYLNFPVHLPDAAQLSIQAAAATRVYSHGNVPEILAFRFQETRQLSGDKAFHRSAARVDACQNMGIVLLGIAAQRSEFLRAPRRRLLIVLILGSVAGVAAGYLKSDVVAFLAVATAYASAILLWVRRSPLLAAAGRMTLTTTLRNRSCLVSSSMATDFSNSAASGCCRALRRALPSI